MILEEKLKAISKLEEDNHLLGCSFMAKDNSKAILAENASDYVLEVIQQSIELLQNIDSIPVRS